VDTKNYLFLFLGIVFIVSALSILFPGFANTFIHSGQSIFPWFLVLTGLALVMYARNLTARAAPAIVFGFLLIVAGIGMAGYNVLALLGSTPQFISAISMLVGIGLIIWGVSKFTRFSIVALIGGIIAIGIGAAMAGVNLSGIAAVGNVIIAMFQNVVVWIVLLILGIVAAVMKARGLL